MKPPAQKGSFFDPRGQGYQFLSNLKVHRAVELAAAAHAGQHDKAGRPYILHVMTVVAKTEKVVRQIEEVDRDAYVQVAALHDIVEDTEYTLEDLRDVGFSELVVTAVDAISRRPVAQVKEDYTEYIHRVAQNAIARVVKLADLEHHLERAEVSEALTRKYQRAKATLEGVDDCEFQKDP